MLNMSISDSMKQDVAQSVSILIYNAVQDSYNEMKTYVDSKLEIDTTSLETALSQRISKLEQKVEELS